MVTPRHIPPISCGPILPPTTPEIAFILLDWINSLPPHFYPHLKIQAYTPFRGTPSIIGVGPPFQLIEPRAGLTKIAGDTEREIHRATNIATACQAVPTWVQCTFSLRPKTNSQGPVCQIGLSKSKGGAFFIRCDSNSKQLPLSVSGSVGEW